MKKIHIDWANKYLEIQGIAPNQFSYDISFGQIQNEGLSKWLPHLRSKNWWDKNLEVEFINATLKINNYGKI